MTNDDIVERLRGWVPSDFWNRAVGEMRDAADEIERLRALVDDYENGISWYTTCTNCAKLMDVNYDQYCQIERLRAAGDALAATWPEEDRCNCNNPDCRAVVAAFDAWQEARRGQ